MDGDRGRYPVRLRHGVGPGGLVVLGGTRTGPDFCMPYSLASKDGRMKAVFETTFKAREGSAMIDLERVRGQLPATAQAPSQPER